MVAWLPVMVTCLGLMGFCGGTTSSLYKVAYQVMMNSLIAEERVRSEGQSGVKQMRITKAGASPYHSPTHIGGSIISSHEHANNIRTVGQGEITVVMNGVEFRTRHNDYKLVMPSTTDMTYNKVEDIEHPDVPPEVTSKETPKEETEEMKEWFRAHITQNKTHRNYVNYFKPILCYMEGAWMNANENLVEPFASDRHHLDAVSWENLVDKVKFRAHTGSKDNNENLAFLPMKIMKVDSDGTPHMVQWNYRILCHPIQRELPLSALHTVDDLAARMLNRRDIYTAARTRAMRFQLNLDDSGEFKDTRAKFRLLDEIMSEIPGANNYPGYLTDNAFGLLKQDLDGKPLNAARYNHVYRTEKKGAMGRNEKMRGFSDDFLFVALTNASEIAEVCMDSCKDKDIEKCDTYCQRATYAIPLEIIFLTPLTKWNPYNINYYDEENKGVPVKDGRDGDINIPEKAYNGTDHRRFYRTPVDFFYSGSDSKTSDPADTSDKAAGVLDADKNLYECQASGPRIGYFVDEGLYFRQRYVVAPIHDEGRTVRKEVEALKNAVLRPEVHHFLYQTLRPVKLVLPENENRNAFHSHELPELTPSNMEALVLHDRTVTITSLSTDDHVHDVTIRYNRYPKDHESHFLYEKCDGRNSCKHAKSLVVKEDPLLPRQASEV